MTCDECKGRGRKPKRTPAPGFCDACGWAISAEGVLLKKDPRAQYLVGVAAMVRDNNEGRDPWAYLRDMVS